MTTSIRHPATRADILAVLMRGAGQASVMRLAAGDGLSQVERGLSYVLEENGQPIAIGGLWPAKGPARVLEIAAGRTPYAIWFICAPDARRHIRAIRHACDVVFGDMAKLNSFLVAEVDPDLQSAPRLARIVGLVPLERVDGHDLWTFDAAR